jgi:hypothetical protein
MRKECKLVVLVNGSPKLTAEQSASEQMLRLQESSMQAPGIEFYRIHVRSSLKKDKIEKDFEAMLEADAILFTFPLYIFCLPGIMIRYLQDFYEYWKERQGFRKKVKISAVVNCGFPEAFINEEAVRVIKSFCRQTGADFHQGIMLGGGGMLFGIKDVPYMRKLKEELIAAYQRITEDIVEEKIITRDTISIRANCPTRLYYFMGDRGWYQQAKKNGLKKRDLYRRPYLKEL